MAALEAAVARLALQHALPLRPHTLAGAPRDVVNTFKPTAHTELTVDDLANLGSVAAGVWYSLPSLYAVIDSVYLEPCGRLHMVQVSRRRPANHALIDKAYTVKGWRAGGASVMEFWHQAAFGVGLPPPWVDLQAALRRLAAAPGPVSADLGGDDFGVSTAFDAAGSSILPPNMTYWYLCGLEEPMARLAYAPPGLPRALVAESPHVYLSRL